MTRSRQLNPYQDLPTHCFWNPSVGGIDVIDVDPMVVPRFKIGRDDRVATAGSCFAQHIARRLQANGYNYFIPEQPHPIVSEAVARTLNYGTFSARYGNVYTPRQLLQLFRRAFGSFVPLEDLWHDAEGRVVDPFRPRIQPEGFVSDVEMRRDREQSLRCTRRMFEEVDVFVFTLGLTEAWVSRRDGSVYPVCPGVAGGQFDLALHEMKNFTVAEVVADLTAFMTEFRDVNPAARVIFTVSPVPLAATARADAHVLAATTYSKSVLRVACEEMKESWAQTEYFPSYEIITGSYSRGAYFSRNLRDVLEAGVDHVMTTFFRHFADASEIDQPTTVQSVRPERSALSDAEDIVAAICEEELLAIR